MADEAHTASRVVGASPEAVFRILSDPHAHLEWLPDGEHVRYEIEYLSGPARGEGGRYELRTFRGGHRRPQRGRMTITVCDVSRCIEFTGDGGMSTRFDLEPHEDGTRVTASRIYRGVKASRALNRVVKPRTVVESLERDLRRLELALHSGD